MTAEIRVALIGYGLAGAVFHAPTIAVTPGLRLATIVTRDPERRARAGREHPTARVVDTAEQIFAQPAAHDLVVIATPNSTHVPLALAALATGHAVVIDKPFAPAPDEGRRIIADARRRGLFLSVYHQRRWDSDTLTIRRLLAEGVLGEVVRFESRFERWRPEPGRGWRERAGPGDAGGLLYDLGPHLVDQALHLFGPVTHVYGELARCRPGAVVDDDVFVALTHASGARSHLWASAVAAQRGPRVRVLGTRAAYVKEAVDGQEAALIAGTRPDRPDWGVESAERWGRLGAGDAVRPVSSEPGAYPHYYAGVAASLRAGAPPPVDAADAVAGLEIIAAVQRSATGHHPVALGAGS
ncbi:MAG TPA: Gfo/Idh/MocA family oxidoreductase [Methylomirabilota bacterium]|nr:Gfo/Idh/MocA family oxidoreductase [Methylomirabilota bacterium]